MPPSPSPLDLLLEAAHEVLDAVRASRDVPKLVDDAAGHLAEAVIVYYRKVGRTWHRE